MIPEAISCGAVTDLHLRLLERARVIMAGLPPATSCHKVCAALANYLPGLTHRRGYFQRKGFEHSWCEVVDTHLILDAYPWASASGPLLVSTDSVLNPWRRLYIPVPFVAEPYYDYVAEAYGGRAMDVELWG